MALLGMVLDNRYEIVGRLGAGGMAIVFLAKDRELERSVAVKVMQRSIAANSRLLERFRREVSTCAKIRHPNVVQIFGFGVLKDGSPYYVMELLQCPSLKEVIKEEGALPEAEVIEIVSAVADALSEIHGQGLVHRDLKPGNIMLPERGCPKVVDFGLVHDDSLTQLTKTGEMVGTPLYCSPELVEGVQIDGRSDLFQLGAICYELLTGKQAFQANTMEGVLGKIITGRCPSLAEYENKLEHSWQPFIEKCLKADPDKRFQSTQEVLEAINNLDGMMAEDLFEDTGSQRPVGIDSSLSTPSVVSQPKKVLPILLVLSFCVMALIVLFSRPGSDETVESTTRKLPQRFERPKLVDLSKIQLNYTKSLKGQCTISFDNGLPAQKLKMSEGKALSASLRCQIIKLEPPLIEATKLKLVQAETSKEWSFLIDPEKVFSQVFGPLDRLSGDQLTRVCLDLSSKRQELNKTNGHLRKDEFNAKALPAMLAVLSQYGIDGKAVDKLKVQLPRILDGRVKPGHQLAHRLLPLQHIESAAWCDQGFTMPWPSVPKLLGIRIANPESPHPQDLQRVSFAPLCDLNSRMPWLWMSTATVIAGEKKNPPAMRIVFREVINKLIQNYAKNKGKGESTPHIENIVSKKDFSFYIDEGLRPWPPQKTKMSIVIRLFSRGFALRLRVNDKGPITLTNFPFLATVDNHSANMPATRYTLPLIPSWLKKGENTLSLQVIACPGTRPNAALSLRKFYLWAL